MSAAYRPLIEDMTWSYSRIECFADCPYRFFMKYIMEYDEEPQFYSSYGSFIHKLIEEYYRGYLSKSGMQNRFLLDFKKEVSGSRPSDSIVTKYIQSGIDYLEGFERFPYDMVDVEKRIEFSVGKRKFVGVIDYIGKDGSDLIIIDNKSRCLKPRSGKSKPTQNDMEIDSMLRQLYIYSSAIEKEYGSLPKKLCFNCFRNNTFIEEPFNYDSYVSALEWAEKTINRICFTERFYPNVDFFSCKYICGFANECCYWQRR